MSTMAGMIYFSDFVQFPLSLFKVIGLTPERVRSDTKKERLRRIFYRLVMANFFLNAFEILMYLKVNASNMILITENVLASGNAPLAIIKLLTLSQALPEFRDLMETLSDLFPKSQREQKLYNIQKYLRSYKIVERLIYWMLVSFVMMFFLLPIVKLVVFKIPFGKLPYDNWYPFDPRNPKYFNFVYIWQFIQTLITMIPLAAPDLMFFSIITMIRMQFDILCHKIRHLEALETEEIGEEFKKLIQLHETLLRLSANLEKIYSISIFYNLAIDTVWICLAGFQVSIQFNLESIFKFADFFLILLSGTFLLCYFSQKLTTAAEKVADAAYDFPWEEKENRKHKTSVLMLLERSQKPLFISAFKFSAVSLELYATVRS